MKGYERFLFFLNHQGCSSHGFHQLRFQVTAWKDVAATSRMDVAPWFGQLWGHREGLPVSTKSKTKGLTPGVADCITQSMPKTWKQWKTWEDIYGLVVLTILNNISQWEGLSHILWKIKTCLKPPTIYIYMSYGKYHLVHILFDTCWHLCRSFHAHVIISHGPRMIVNNNGRFTVLLRINQPKGIWHTTIPTLVTHWGLFRNSTD